MRNAAKFVVNCHAVRLFSALLLGRVAQVSARLDEEMLFALAGPAPVIWSQLRLATANPRGPVRRVACTTGRAFNGQCVSISMLRASP